MGTGWLFRNIPGFPSPIFRRSSPYSRAGIVIPASRLQIRSATSRSCLSGLPMTWAIFSPHQFLSHPHGLLVAFGYLIVIKALSLVHVRNPRCRFLFLVQLFSLKHFYLGTGCQWKIGIAPISGENVNHFWYGLSAFSIPAVPAEFLFLSDPLNIILTVLDIFLHHMGWRAKQVGQIHIGALFFFRLFCCLSVFFHGCVSFPRTLSTRWLSGFFFFVYFSSILT